MHVLCARATADSHQIHRVIEGGMAVKSCRQSVQNPCTQYCTHLANSRVWIADMLSTVTTRRQLFPPLFYDVKLLQNLFAHNGHRWLTGYCVRTGYFIPVIYTAWHHQWVLLPLGAYQTCWFDCLAVLVIYKQPKRLLSYTSCRHLTYS